MPARNHVEEDKGDQVRVVGGVCQGCLGWIHRTANTFEDKMWIIVEAGRNSRGQEEPEKARLIKKENISPELTSTPSTYEQALLSEHTDIHTGMKKVAKALAEFDDLEPSEAMMQVFFGMWVQAKGARRGRRRVSGSRFVHGWHMEESIYFDPEQPHVVPPDNNNGNNNGQ